VHRATRPEVSRLAARTLDDAGRIPAGGKGRIGDDDPARSRVERDG
jgi:hypothetical protein